MIRTPVAARRHCRTRTGALAALVSLVVASCTGGNDRPSVAGSGTQATSTHEPGTTLGTATAPPTPTVPIDADPSGSGTSGTGAWPAGTEIALGIPGHEDRPTLLLHGASATSPLVAVFHGSGGSIENIKERSELHTLAAAAGVALLWLSGKPLPDRHWNTQSTCCGPAYEQRINDFPYIDAALVEVRARGLRPAAFLTAGVSAGAGMAVTVACKRRSVFSTVISIGGWRPISCANKQLSLVAIGGTEDEVFGGDGARRLARQWRSAVLRCRYRSTETWVGTTLITEWRDCPNGGRIRLVEVAGLKHVWPRTDDFDASREIIDTALAAA